MSEIAPSAMDGAQIDLEEAISAAKGTCLRTTRPILFSGPMVRALIEGRKTQTRRILQPQPELMANGLYHVIGSGGGVVNVAEPDVGREAVEYQRYAAGDLLWVRETWQAGSSYDGPQVSYQATPDYFEINAWDGPDEGAGPSFNYDKCPGTDFAHWLPDVLSNDGPWRPSIHMPRWASRLTLEVTGVRVERLQDISEADALAEGMTLDALRAGDIPPSSGPIGSFARLWNDLNSERGFGWEANPWVVAVSFRVHHANVDDVLAREAAQRKEVCDAT